MNNTWRSDIIPDPATINWVGWFRVILRATPIFLILGLGLLLLLFVRLFERPIWHQHRPWTPHITKTVCRLCLFVLGLGYRVSGTQMQGLGAVVANHSTWLDILVLNASQNIYFVAKSEVANWPVIGWLARATGTVFIRRTGRDAKVQKEIFESRLTSGHRLLFFPEGTSTDGTLVLPFKSTLFAAFFTKKLQPILSIQPVAVVYTPPEGQNAQHYGWWGAMDLAPHLIKILANRTQGSVTVTYHNALQVSDFENRKDLALACETAIRSTFPKEPQSFQEN
ncbi:MAG: lysophospholipid acyltransferase family protein [Paracoccaceae bacterium]